MPVTRNTSIVDIAAIHSGTERGTTAAKATSPASSQWNFEHRSRLSLDVLTLNVFVELFLFGIQYFYFPGLKIFSRNVVNFGAVDVGLCIRCERVFGSGHIFP